MAKARIEQKVALCIDGKEVTKCIYDCGEISNDIALMKKGNELHIFNALTGDFKFKLDDVKRARYSNNSLIVTSVSGAMGVYDFVGRVLVPIKYKEIRNRGSYYVAKEFDSEIAILYKRDEENETANVIISHEKGFMELKLCNEGVITCNFQNEYGVYSYSGNELIPTKYDMIQAYGYSYIVSTEESNSRKHGVYSSLGERILDDVYTYYELDLPLVYFTKDQKKCAYNLYTCKKVAELKYDKITKFEDAISATEDNKSYYLISADTGKQLFEWPFDRITVYRQRILLLETSKRSNLYYLTAMGKFIDADSYEVKYDDGRYYLRRIVRQNGKRLESDSPWELILKDNLY